MDVFFFCDFLISFPSLLVDRLVNPFVKLYFPSPIMYPFLLHPPSFSFGVFSHGSFEVLPAFAVGHISYLQQLQQLGVYSRILQHYLSCKHMNPVNVSFTFLLK